MKRKFPPSPPKLPFIGNLHHLGSLPHHSIRALSDKHGTLMLLHLGHSPTLVVSSAEMAREIMNTRDIEFANRHVTWATSVLFYGCKEVIFGPYCESWRELRKFRVTELLNQKKLQSFDFIREEETDDLIAVCVLGEKHQGDIEPGFGEVSKKVLDLCLDFSFRDFFLYVGWMDKLTGLDSKVKLTFEEVDRFLDQAIKEQEHKKDH
ncbi:Cytochrome P450 [Dillenia turbinata]|uniref:Cytochrome P450 n=1 Tax=Dillenia turbinata TaxID=194707 RepID=A0AAN8Z4T9_9MAGN